MANKTPSTSQINELKSENKTLKLELDKLRKSAASGRAAAKKPTGNIWRKSGVVASIVVATSLLVAGNLLFWAGNTVVDPQRFNAAVSPLIKSDEVHQAVSTYVTDQLFKQVDVQQVLSENLPERISFAAPALANQIQSTTQAALVKVMQNESFQQTFNTTVATTHAKIIAFVGNSQGDGVVQLSEVYDQLVARLADTRLSFLSKEQLPEGIGSITIINAQWLPAARNIVNNIDIYRSLAVMLCVGFIALAIWLSANRRRATITIGLTFAGFMALTLVAVRLTQHYMVGGVPIEYQSVAGVVYESFASSLLLQTRLLFVLGILISLVAWIGGPYKSATAIRSRVQTLFGGNVHQALFGSNENAMTLWLGQHKRAVQWALVALAAVSVVVLPIGLSTMLFATICLIVLVLLVEALAAPAGATTGSVQSNN